MPTAKLYGLVHHLGAGASNGATSAGDGELLGRFIASRDEAAFAELVRRHGRLVFGVCRRVAGNHHLAEDAFQAVFVVLAAKAAAIRPAAAVGAWLHGVAFRTALRARTMADRRRRRETPVGTLPESVSSAAVEEPDAVTLLDEEIARLPDRLRAAVVSCEIEGAGRKEAARRLGIREGTLSSRLAAARKALAERLRQRGVVLSATGLSSVLGQAATATPPAALAARAQAIAVLAPELIPPAVGVLSNGVLRIMLLDKLKTRCSDRRFPSASPRALHSPLRRTAHTRPAARRKASVARARCHRARRPSPLTRSRCPRDRTRFSSSAPVTCSC